jgi:hypothetical protein
MSPPPIDLCLLVGGEWVLVGSVVTQKNSTHALLYATNTEVTESRIELNLKYSIFH